MRPEQLGEKGESRFKELCADAGLVANKSSVDLMGWDYLVECPYTEPDTTTPLDKRPHPIVCKVQVKTIWADVNQVDLKLSAAERLAKVDMPSFVVVLSVDTNLSFVAMHVFHMLGHNLEHVLTRLRKATAEGSLKINHSQITFNLRDGTRLTPDGASLIRFIADACGPSTAAYHAQKQDQLRNLGFGELRFEGKFTVKAKNQSELNELFLGLRPAELVTFDTSEIRFGIKLPAHAQSGGTIEIIPRPVDKCRIIARGRDDGINIRIDGSLYLPPHRNPTGDIPFRISTPFLDFYINGDEINIHNHMDRFLHTPATIADILVTLRLHRMIANGGGHFTIIARNKTIMSGEIDTPREEAIFSEMDKQIRLLDITLTVFKTAEAHMKQVTLEQIFANSIDLMFLYDLIKNSGDVKINPLRFRPERDLPPISESLLIRKITFQDFSISYYATMDVTVKNNHPDVVLDVGSVSLRDVTVIDDDAFGSYCEEARHTTGIAMSLVMNPECT